MNAMQLLLNWKNFKTTELSTKPNFKHSFLVSAWKIKSCDTLEKYSSRRGFACLEASQKGSTSPATKDSLSSCKEKMKRFCIA